MHHVTLAFQGDEGDELPFVVLSSISQYLEVSTAAPGAACYRAFLLEFPSSARKLSIWLLLFLEGVKLCIEARTFRVNFMTSQSWYACLGV